MVGAPAASMARRWGSLASAAFNAWMSTCSRGSVLAAATMVVWAVRAGFLVGQLAGRGLGGAKSGCQHWFSEGLLGNGVDAPPTRSAMHQLDGTMGQQATGMGGIQVGPSCGAVGRQWPWLAGCAKKRATALLCNGAAWQMKLICLRQGAQQINWTACWVNGPLGQAVPSGVILLTVGQMGQTGLWQRGQQKWRPSAE